MSRRVFLCAGHGLGGGARANRLRENPYNFIVGGIAMARLRRWGIDARIAPLRLRGYPHDIRAKIDWVNRRARPDDLAVDIHLDIGAPGSVAFATERQRDLQAAETLARAIADATGLACRGGRPETATAVGRLGFLHECNCRSLLVELCSMNTGDARYARRIGAPWAFAEGLALGCREVLDLG